GGVNQIAPLAALEMLDGDITWRPKRPAHRVAMPNPARYIGPVPACIMPTRLNRLSSTMACALLVSGAPAALSQSPPKRPPPGEDAVERSETVQLGRVVVLGMRSSLATAQQIKRGKYEIVDSVVAD